jgi:hypothetical protein
MSPMQFWVVQFRSSHHSSLGVRYLFLVAFEEGEQHRDELASDTTNHFALASILPRTLVIDAFARHQVGVQAGKLIVRDPQGLPDRQIERMLERPHPSRRQALSLLALPFTSMFVALDTPVLIWDYSPSHHTTVRCNRGVERARVCPK